MRRTAILFMLAATMLVAAPVNAQSAPENHAAADALYEESGALMKSGRFAEACPKLETSQRLDPGVGTLLRLGYCYEHVGRTASAWSAYNDAEAMARKTNDKRADDAAGRAKAVEPKLSKVVFSMQNPAPGLEIRRDGTLLDAGILGTAVPVDPGEHLIEVRAPGRRTWTTKITITGSGTTKTEVPPLADAPLEAPPPAPPFWSAQRIAGISVAGVGVISLAVGTAFGVQTLKKTSDAKADCSATQPYCAPAGVSLENDAKTTARVSDATLAIGGAAVAVGLIVFLVAPSAAKTSGAVRVAPVVGMGQAGLAAAGRW